jgi:DNA-damage-inducible protein J
MTLNGVVRARVDQQLKSEVEKIFEEIGLNTSQAINIFLKRVVMERGIPFDVKAPSPQLKKAIVEAENNEGTFHNSIEDLMKDLKS